MHVVCICIRYNVSPPKICTVSYPLFSSTCAHGSLIVILPSVNNLYLVLSSLPFYYVNLVYRLSVARHISVYIVINSTDKRQGVTERPFALGLGDVSILEKNTNTRDGGYDKGLLLDVRPRSHGRERGDNSSKQQKKT